MSDYFLDQAEAIQALSDANCPKDFIQQFLDAMESGNTTAQLRLLRIQRDQQLQRMHDEAKRLDILDYLRYQLEKRNNQPKAKEISCAS